MMKELRTSDERAALLPSGSNALFVVLFWRKSNPTAAAFRRQCSEIVWPRWFRTVSVDLDTAAEVAAWFETPIVPMLAVVTDGAMLCVEYDCTIEACRKLADCGRSQYSMMRSMSG